MDRWRWLESTRRLQESSYDVKFPLTGEELADYVTYNHSALVVELSEFMAEIQWKPWASPRGSVNRARAVQELVDVGHFLANLICALDVTDDEWDDAYRRKQRVNARRQIDGYDGFSTKCSGCRRSLDEDDSVIISGERRFCGGCGKYIGVNP